MKFSIITITYNRAHLIAQTIDSVLNQTYQNYELIIVDDDSTDNTEAVVNTYQNENPNKIKYIKTNRLGAPSKLRNIGLKAAKGDIISVLDSDDLWLEEKLEEMHAIFSKHNDVNFIMHNLQRFSEIDRLNKPYYNFKTSFYKDIMQELLMCKILAFPVFSMRISLLDEIGFFDEEIVEGQHDYYLKVASKHKVFYLNKPLTLMRRHKGNYTKSYDVIHCLDAIKSYDKLYHLKKLDLKQYKVASNFMNFKIANFYYQNNEKENARIYIKHILSNSSFLDRWYIRANRLMLKNQMNERFSI
ncbi:glycosyltransferase family 2 protein [Winogradskyella flava]|uniref:Glycosyltransferase family 2 protein n=1 Tax=Winogradskyella flava TaxID=1884876 RepID=A0A842ILW4_9FLAO|nr:glycosyltransferase family 2 protein [Winogradskyella flava]MBC2843625.1 glycosyltransferase family 2 protein [Winogradskyella flava]